MEMNVESYFSGYEKKVFFDQILFIRFFKWDHFVEIKKKVSTLENGSLKNIKNMLKPTNTITRKLDTGIRFGKVKKYKILNYFYLIFLLGCLYK